MRKHLLPVLLLVAAVWFLYSQTGRFAFVKDGLSAANVKEAFANPRHAAIWMPATYISYMADITLFGPGMGPHHLVNVALHTLNALLLYALLLALLPRTADAPGGTRAVASAALALLAWIAGRKELLCALFTLLGLHCWLRPGRRWTLAATLCCALACMSKPSVSHPVENERDLAERVHRERT